MTDLMYFGYHWDKDSLTFENEFKEEIIKEFPNVKLVNAYDDIKGYRQEVHLPDDQKDIYLSWLIARGWFEMSLTMQLIMMDSDRKPEFDKIFSLSKKRYPESFKPESLES